MPALVDDIEPSRLITIINPRMVPDTPGLIAPGAHLKIAVSDICEPAAGRVCAEPAHVAELVRFVRDWNHDGDLVIHCLAGVSRSTAAAFITLCALNETVSETSIAQLLRSSSPSASPNRLLIGLADEVLARRGRMLEAVAAMGPGTIDGIEGQPFSMPSRLA